MTSLLRNENNKDNKVDGQGPAHLSQPTSNDHKQKKVWKNISPWINETKKTPRTLIGT
jgi:hypothetical protein